MRKKLFLVLAVVCCIAVFAGVFAGCNNGDGKGSGGSTGAGDKIFTEGATLEEILTALENAESLTFSTEYQEVGTYNGEEYRLKTTVQFYLTREGYICESSSTEVIGSEADPADGIEYCYRSGEINYRIYFGDVGYDSGDHAYKEFAQYSPDMYAENLYACGAGNFSGMVTEDANGDLVTVGMSGESIEGAYVKLNGNSIEIGWEEEYSDEYYDTKDTYRLVWSGVNATTIDIPADVRALEAQAEWSESVTYNGIVYGKAEDEQGEYYYVDNKNDASAVPEETINGLPVRKDA